MDQILAQLTGFWRGLNAAQRIAFAAIALIVSGALDFTMRPLARSHQMFSARWIINDYS